MFLKVKVVFDVVEGNNYTLCLGSSEDQIVLQFASSGTTVREELVDIASSCESLQVSVLSEGEKSDSSEVDLLDISMRDVTEKQKSEWILVKDQYKISITVTSVDQAPDDWFERGVALLGQEEKPWYLTAEDLYKCTKDMMASLSGKVSEKVSLPSTYWEEMVQKLDFVTSKVAEKFLHIQVEEGFSLVAKIDELMEQLLSSTDDRVDEHRLKLALKLQQLRKNVTLHLHDLSQSLSTKMDVYRTQMNNKKEALDKSVATAYSWAADTSTSTSNWMAQAERQEIINKIDALRLSGKELLDETQTRVKETRDQVVSAVVDTRDQVVSKVSDTRDQVVNEVQAKLNAADEALRVQLPAVAHPYVVQAVSLSQPYVDTAMNKATPLVQSVREKEAVKNLESWVMNEKKDQLLALLEENKDTPAGSLVSALLSQASQVITEVTDYCLNADYFERNQGTPVGSFDAARPNGRDISDEQLPAN